MGITGLTPGVLEELHVVEGLSANKIASRYGVRGWEIRKARLLKYGFM